MQQHDFDVLIVGSGLAGLSAALMEPSPGIAIGVGGSAGARGSSRP